MKTITRQELYAAAAAATSYDLSLADATEVVDQAIEDIVATVGSGESVKIAGFASFHPIMARARTVRVRGPDGVQFGAEKILPAHLRVSVRWSLELKAQVAPGNRRR